MEVEDPDEIIILESEDIADDVIDVDKDDSDTDSVDFTCEVIKVEAQVFKDDNGVTQVPQPKQHEKMNIDEVKEEDDACPLQFCGRIHTDIITLSDCGHIFFRDCLAKTILKSDEPQAICPFRKNKRGMVPCEKMIFEEDVKKILSQNDFNEYLSNYLSTYQKQIKNAFHCKTPNCHGWCILEGYAMTFQCPVCTKINCLLCHNIHAEGICKELSNILNSAEENTESLKETKNLSKKVYPRLLDLYYTDLVLYASEFECIVCMTNVLPMEGVILKSCLHYFCRSCLQNTIRTSETVDIKCPYMDDKYSCDNILYENEIKALLSEEEYEARLAKTLAFAEVQTINNFHCKTADCAGWCIIEQGAEQFLCPVCNRNNCLICATFHDGMTCEQYQQTLNCGISEDKIEELITSGEAMKCPNCSALIQKQSGCDALQCTFCKIDICWVTKQARWGKGGRGDYSGGCKCNWKGVKCHPKCANCH